MIFGTALTSLVSHFSRINASIAALLILFVFSRLSSSSCYIPDHLDGITVMFVLENSG